MKANKRLLLGVCAGLLVGAAALTTASALAPEHPHSDLLLANAEALSQSENEGETEAQCADYGYKKWKYERPTPDAIFEGFKDCWCQDRSGYDPTSCK